MTKAPGENPGPSSSVPGYSRPGLALVIAAFGFVVTLLVLIGYPRLRAPWLSLPEWLLALIDLVVISLPLVVAVIVAGIAASKVGVARATGIRHWHWTDLAYGVGVGLAVRALVELIAPTSGTLGGPFGERSVATTIVVAAGVVLVSPFVEEWFFRGLVLRAFADAFAAAGRPVASIVAILVSTAAFCGLHIVTLADVPVSLLIGTIGIGLGCGILVVMTGRLGGALLAHVTFNAIGVALLLM